MNSRQIVATALTLIGTTWTLALAEAREGQLSELSVHTYNYSGVSADELAAARRHAEAIFRRANITISWSRLSDLRPRRGSTSFRTAEPTCVPMRSC